MEKSLNTKRKRLGRALLIFSALIVVLFSALLVHIYQVTKPIKYDNNDLQLSRIDFKQQIDSVQANEIRHFVATLPGVQNTMFNIKDGILVYGYTLGKQNSNQVFEQLINHFHYKSEKFVLNEKMKTQGCPMAGKDRSGFIYRFTAYIYRLLN